MGQGWGDPGNQEKVHQAIQDAEARPGAVLTGWVLVAEWYDGDGTRWLSRAAASGQATWASAGMLHEALYGTWPASG